MRDSLLYVNENSKQTSLRLFRGNTLPLASIIISLIITQQVHRTILVVIHSVILLENNEADICCLCEFIKHEAGSTPVIHKGIIHQARVPLTTQLSHFARVQIIYFRSNNTIQQAKHSQVEPSLLLWKQRAISNVFVFHTAL